MTGITRKSCGALFPLWSFQKDMNGFSAFLKKPVLKDSKSIHDNKDSDNRNNNDNNNTGNDSSNK